MYLKFKPLLRCAYVRCFNLCPESLDAKTGQFAGLLGRGWERVDWEGRGGVFCGIGIIFIYIFTYLHFYSVSVAVLWLFILLFLLRVPYPPIFFCVFSVLFFCILLGEGHVVSPPSVCSPSIKVFLVLSWFNPYFSLYMINYWDVILVLEIVSFV